LKRLGIPGFGITRVKQVLLGSRRFTRLKPVPMRRVHYNDRTKSIKKKPIQASGVSGADSLSGAATHVDVNLVQVNVAIWLLHNLLAAILPVRCKHDSLLPVIRKLRSALSEPVSGLS